MKGQYCHWIRYCLCCLNGIIFGHYWVNLDIRRSTVKLKLRWWVLFARCNYDKPLPPSLSPVWCDRGVAGTGIWHRRPSGASSHQPSLITNTPASPYLGLDIVDTGKMSYFWQYCNLRDFCNWRQITAQCQSISSFYKSNPINRFMNHISAAAAVLSNQTRGETVIIIIIIFSATYFALFGTLYPFVMLIHFSNSKPII